MTIRRYTLAAHLIHSRMQLIRYKLKLGPDTKIADLVIKYQDYFDKAAASVLENHMVSCEQGDIRAAAELLYRSNFPKPGKNDLCYYVLQFDKDSNGDWIDISWWDKKQGYVAADPLERLTQEEANERYQSLQVSRIMPFRVHMKFEGRQGE